MSPALLLDTCACIWLIDNELPDRALQLLTAAYNAGRESYISPITAWEIGMLARKRRLKSQLAPERWFATLLALPGLTLAEMTASLLLQAGLLDGDLHGDPVDRIIAATAREYGYTVMTRDRALLDYGRQGYLSVVAC
jgi:PIN domain nuclease of toxin-antitoxin system